MKKLLWPRDAKLCIPLCQKNCGSNTELKQRTQMTTRPNVQVPKLPNKDKNKKKERYKKIKRWPRDSDFFLQHSQTIIVKRRQKKKKKGEKKKKGLILEQKGGVRGALRGNFKQQQWCQACFFFSLLVDLSAGRKRKKFRLDVCLVGSFCLFLFFSLVEFLT
ncbi:hypothetical protein RFI_23692 [Reticulomyxa filosa]|uniref:Uncharacterized protein n=1 Tax=Reticulomyxa filosa TaxID=46433 RepID=X6MJP9_RETFI|nr:hypothetical protein RFI_23692 [Reticulomyxa filosa]|eukprot:ETO13677.1 hypothetical protein RFI_23692 [Reticulomyxa filosa]